jgi:hypothetical protein
MKSRDNAESVNVANLATLNVIFRSPTASCAGHQRIDCVAMNVTPSDNILR